MDQIYHDTSFFVLNLKKKSTHLNEKLIFNLNKLLLNKSN